jgi:hypothetical protein
MGIKTSRIHFKRIQLLDKQNERKRYNNFTEYNLFHLLVFDYNTFSGKGFFLFTKEQTFLQEREEKLNCLNKQKSYKIMVMLMSAI